MPLRRRSRPFKQIIEDVQGDLYLYAVGEIDATVLAQALGYASREIKAAIRNG